MPRQPLIRALARIAAATAIAGLALGAPAAFAQYSITAAGTPSGPGTCNFGTASVPVNGGSLMLTLPPGTNNVQFTSSVNGGPLFTAFETNASGVIPEAAFGFEVSPPTLPPYTMTETLFPAVGGVATGTGVVFTVTCTALGGATVSWVNNVPAAGGGGGGPVAASVAVPTLSAPALVALAALLATAGLLGFAGRRR